MKLCDIVIMSGRGERVTLFCKTHNFYMIRRITEGIPKVCPDFDKEPIEENPMVDSVSANAKITYGYYDSTNMSYYGWICPECGRIYSPSQTECYRCNGYWQTDTSPVTENQNPTYDTTHKCSCGDTGCEHV